MTLRPARGPVRRRMHRRARQPAASDASGWSSTARPHVLPVNYACRRNGASCTARPPKVAAREVDGQSVVFEVDGFDECRKVADGASASTARPRGDVARRPRRARAARRSRPRSRWAPGPRDRWFSITPDEVTGRSVELTGDCPITRAGSRESCRDPSEGHGRCTGMVARHGASIRNECWSLLRGRVSDGSRSRSRTTRHLPDQLRGRSRHGRVPHGRGHQARRRGARHAASPSRSTASTRSPARRGASSSRAGRPRSRDCTSCSTPLICRCSRGSPARSTASFASCPTRSRAGGSTSSTRRPRLQRPQRSSHE